MKKPKKHKPKAKQRAPPAETARASARAPRGSGRSAAVSARRRGGFLALPRGLKRELAPLTAMTLQAFYAAGKAASEFGLMARRVPGEFGPALSRMRTRATAVSLSYNADEREVLGLLFLPFLLLASAIVISQSVRHLSISSGPVAVSVPDAQPLSPRDMQRRAIAALPSTALKAKAPQSVVASQPVTGSMRSSQTTGDLVPSAPTAAEAVPLAVKVPTLAAQDQHAGELPAFLPGESLAVAPAATAPRELAARADAQPLAAVPQDRTLSSSIERGTTLASLLPDRLVAGAPSSQRPLPPLTAPEITTLEDDGDGRASAMCRATPKAEVTGVSIADPKTMSPGEFGQRLAAAARAQLESFVVYNAEYSTISYPMGDVPAIFGVCTDVVVRAYRALGIDLQALVHEARVGSGDTSIDHRRVEVLRRFFAKEGASVPITTFAEDYLPGDIVTYYRPQNQHTTTHIAIISSVIAPSGRPMIIHNRGWGPQMEDALFVDEITGHYRYMGRGTVSQPSAKPGTGIVDGVSRRKGLSPAGRSARRVLTPASYEAPATLDAKAAARVN